MKIVFAKMGLLGTVLLPALVFSAALENPLRYDSLLDLAAALVALAVNILLPVAVLSLVYAGFMYVTAAGSQDKIKKAHGLFLYTVLGIALLLGARILADVVVNTLNAITR